MSKATKVPVTERALVQRINRALRDQGEVLKKSRGTQAFLDVGEFYILDIRGNFVAHMNVDIAELGRTLGILKDYEQLAAN